MGESFICVGVGDGGCYPFLLCTYIEICLILSVCMGESFIWVRVGGGYPVYGRSQSRHLPC